MATRNKRAKITLDTTAMTVTYQPYAANGELDGRSVVLSPMQYPEQIRNLLMLDRLRNKAMDAYSDPTADVIESVNGVNEQLLAGNWSARGSGEGAEKTSLFVEAYAKFTHRTADPAHNGQSAHDRGITLEDWIADRRRRVNEIEAGDDDGQKEKLKQVKAHAQIKALMATIQEEKARERAKAAKAAAKQAEPAVAAIL